MNLLLGSSGYVGQAFKKYFEANKIPYITHSVRFPLDEREFTRVLLTNKVKVVYNCAGFTGKPNVDSCELPENKELALFANALLPAQILDLLTKLNVRLVQISSGCIYNDPTCEYGLEPSIIYTTDDLPNFTFNNKKRSWYSGTKALGEELLLSKKHASVAICRLRIPFNGDVNSRNIIHKLINYKTLINATNSFSNLDEFVNSCYIIGNNSYEEGIFNLTQPGYMTTKEIVALLQKYNLVGEKEYFENINTFESTTTAPRSNCVLEPTMFLNYSKDTTLNTTPIEVSMEEAIKQYASNL